ncbi:MAG TPA: hypothetical protein VK191_03785, partial [Symbiobacteriaceae bacterium]|nr:hypothetical protein [Symbiobacteriaceae bacterium]
MKRWLPRLPLLLASIAQVSALMPLALVAAHLMPKDGPAGPTWHLPVPGGALSPFLLLVIWLAGWAISDRARRRQAVLIPVLLAGGLLIAWLIQPQASRSQSIAFPLVVLPVLVGAWWGGGQLGMTG